MNHVSVGSHFGLYWYIMVDDEGPGDGNPGCYVIVRLRFGILDRVVLCVSD
jgi:hypothetical protein